MTTDEQRGEVLATWRKMRGYEQPDLAARLGISYQAVSNWERGTNTPKPSNVKALDDLLDAKGAILALYGVADPRVGITELSGRVAELERQVRELEQQRDILAPQVVENAKELARVWSRLDELARAVQRRVDPAPDSLELMPGLAP